MLTTAWHYFSFFFLLCWFTLRVNSLLCIHFAVKPPQIFTLSNLFSLLFIRDFDFRFLSSYGSHYLALSHAHNSACTMRKLITSKNFHDFSKIYSMQNTPFFRFNQPFFSKIANLISQKLNYTKLWMYLLKHSANIVLMCCECVCLCCNSTKKRWKKKSEWFANQNVSTLVWISSFARFIFQLNHFTIVPHR